jgi:hypothetical protein
VQRLVERSPSKRSLPYVYRCWNGEKMMTQRLVMLREAHVKPTVDLTKTTRGSVMVICSVVVDMTGSPTYPRNADRVDPNSENFHDCICGTLNRVSESSSCGSLQFV